MSASDELRALADPARGKGLSRFFKTGPGEYAEGDRFLGVMVPQIRALARKHRDLSIAGCAKLLQSPFNEERTLALMILVGHFQRGSRAQVFKTYLKNLKRVDNWNLVDASAPYILGAYLLDKERSVLRKLARAKPLWERRIAIVATFAMIRADEFDDTFQLTELLLDDEHDLIHKACGWMLREVGKRDEKALLRFLEEHAARMPRTMLRYAIERFPEARRKAWLRR